MKKNYTFSNHDTVELASKYETPLYVVSEDIMRKNIKNLKKAFEKTKIEYAINYAGKAFLNKCVCNIIKSEGIHLDVASGGELYTALMSNFPPQNICFHGSNKSFEELFYAITNGVGTIVVDSETELNRIAEIANRENKKVNISIRVAPGIEAHTHELIQTGKIDSKFGIPLALTKAVVKKAHAYDKINLIGLHCHIGSQIVDEVPFIKAAEIMLNLYKECMEELKITFNELNLGGGFGIAYLPSEDAFDVLDYIPGLVEHIKEICVKNKMKIPKIVVEPGRYIIATAGITLYTVGTIKCIPHQKNYVNVDGGMVDNPRPALYGAEYDAWICNAKIEDVPMIATISGKACETDTLIKNIQLNNPVEGDILAVFGTGAYNYAMSSNYNRLPKPAVVLLKGDKSEVIVKRETYEDIVKNDIIPSWME